MIKISKLDTCMNRTLNLVVPYILRPVSASPSEDIEEHRQPSMPPDTAGYTIQHRLKGYEKLRINIV
jgi:hypothetical protein